MSSSNRSRKLIYALGAITGFLIATAWVLYAVFTSTTSTAPLVLILIPFYVAMAALAQLNPESDTSRYATILNMFEPGAATVALTDWDFAYLQGLYDAPRAARNSRQQEASIARSMRVGLTEGQAQ